MFDKTAFKFITAFLFILLLSFILFAVAGHYEPKPVSPDCQVACAAQ